MIGEMKKRLPGHQEIEAGKVCERGAATTAAAVSVEWPSYQAAMALGPAPRLLPTVSVLLLHTPHRADLTHEHSFKCSPTTTPANVGRNSLHQGG